ncbi:MAG: divergent polysaccharide deacetylase family protein [Alphaproteobacteria bacterium]|nr:divergent polysaccharide deacetylase family protein [Alphaproteobacteria bacterium]
MRGLSVTKVKDTLDGFFPLRTFAFALGLLMSILIVGVAIYQIFIAAPVENISPTGKTIAMIEIPEREISKTIQPIESTIEKEPPKDIPSVSDEEMDSPPALPHPGAEEAKSPETLPETLPDNSLDIEDSLAGLSEETAFGYLPIIRKSDGLTSFQAYASPFKLNPDTKSIISLVMVDYGLSDSLSNEALKTLPKGLNFVVSPYSDNLQPKISKARAKGIEIWMGIPLQQPETSPETSPKILTATHIGPNTILTGLTIAENKSRLQTHLGRATGYVGIAFDTPPSFPSGSDSLEGLLNIASARGLGVAQLAPQDTLIKTAAAQNAQTPYIGGDLWIDTALIKKDILNALSEIEKHSLETGHTVAMFHPSPLMIKVIGEWQTSLAEKHIQLAPLTYTSKLIKSSSHSSSKSEKTPDHESH